VLEFSTFLQNTSKNGLEITVLYFLIFILFTYLIIILSTAGWWRHCLVRIAKEWHFAASFAKEAP